jgi:hypothetical protein
MNVSLSAETPMVCPHFYLSTLVLTSLVPLGPFDGRVAAVIEDFVCTTPNQNCIFLPAMQNADVRLRADVRYGPDDPTLWPQPWVERYCHLGAIPRKPDDPDDPLSIMWWDPTRDDFNSSGGGLIDGIGELSASKLLPLRKMLSSMEDRIEGHKRAFPSPNKHLLMLVRAMQDSFARIDTLKTTFTDLRVGVTEFQRHYLEVYGCLDYMEIYVPRMDGAKPIAESVMNCVGAITNIPRTVQDFCTAGLPVWFLRPSTTWDTPAKCNILEIVTPLAPASVLCVEDHYPRFRTIFYGSSTDAKKHHAFYTNARLWLVFKDPFEDPKGKSIRLETQRIFTLLLKAHLQLYPLHQVNPLHPVNLLHPFNPLVVAKLFVQIIHGHQLGEHLVHLLHSLWYFILHIAFRPEAPNYANWWSQQIFHVGQSLRSVSDSCLERSASGRRPITF